MTLRPLTSMERYRLYMRDDEDGKAYRVYGRLPVTDLRSHEPPRNTPDQSSAGETSSEPRDPQSSVTNP